MAYSINFESIFEDIGTGVIVRDSSVGIISLNKCAVEIFGYTRDTLINLGIEGLCSLFRNEDGSSVEIDDYPPVKALRTNSIVKDSVLFRIKNMSMQWLSITSIPQYSAEGNTPDSVVSIFKDISASKKAEMQLQENKSFIQLVMDNIPQFIFWKDIDLNYLGCNQNFAKVAGVTDCDSIVGKSDYDLAWEEEEARAFRDDDMRVIGSGNPIFHIIEPQLHADGKKAWLDTNKIPLKDSSGAVKGILGTFEDITQRIQADEELKRLRNYLSNIIDSMPSVIIGINQSGGISLWNKQTQQVSGVAAEDAIGRRITDVLPWMTPHMGLIDDVLTFGKAVQNMRIQRHEGKNKRHKEITIFPLENAAGIEGAIIRMDDVSESVKLQEQLFQSQKMDAIGQLSGGMAHDFNNILGGIFGAADLMIKSIEEGSKNSQYLSLIIDSAERARSLISKLLVFSRSETDYYSLVDVHNVIRDSVAILENTLDKRINLITDLKAENCSVKGDDSQLQTIFLNLAINASHAMPDGGYIEISSSITQLEGSFCRISSFELSPGDYLSLKVCDTGSGIPPEIIPNIFDPFFTTKEQGKGTGLGLSAAYGLIKEMKGAINVYSEIDEGTCFIIYLPLEKNADSTIQRQVEPLYRGEGTILLVDDEAALRITSEAILNGLGYDVVLAENGQEAVNYTASHPGEIDLVVMDMVMPVMNGMDCFRKLREQDRDLAIILSSGFSHSKDVEMLKKEGLNGFIQKPYNTAALSKIVSTVLN